MKYDAIVIGGGAAGLFCAFSAGKREKRVLVLEHNVDVGRKILISGGGRCNFTNIDTTSENFVSQNPHFSKSALSRYSPQDFIDLIKKHRIAFYEKKLGQLFCRDSSRQIVEMLLTECRSAKVEIRTNCRVLELSKPSSFKVHTDQGDFDAENVVVACGGLSFPKIGATDLGFRIARQFELKVIAPRPSLVALVLAGQKYPDLAGVATEAIVKTHKAVFRENILFTHRGLSGPAILQISNYWGKEVDVIIDLLPDQKLDISSNPKQNISNALGRFLPQRLAANIAKMASPKTSVAQLSKSEFSHLEERLKNWTVRFSETEGYDRAEVTIGGVSTDELSSQTMESKRIPGLYFIGEVVDVTGSLGGYNFQWAWASGYAAGTSI